MPKIGIRRRSRPDSTRPAGMVEELERWLRRARMLPLVLPVLLFGGWGLGKLTARGIALPADAPIQVAAAAHTPREHLEELSGFMASIRDAGENTAEYVLLYRNHVLPVEHSLADFGVDSALARRVAWPLVENAYQRGLDPAMVLAVVMVESRGQPDATSFMGARGLMQVMPSHAGLWRGCKGDLYDIETNLCYGTSILADNLRRFRGNEHRALLAYNGCVRGANTPDCHLYPGKVDRIRQRVQRDWEQLTPATRESLLLGTAASP